ncbi:MAG: M23 family metallopeptidase [Bacteroidaceae bacterium]|nr:M23 family metallopeptidase [Candidatus Colenecus caballi]MCQ2071874.1 M23 family metallopeptidase [Bacteroidaceae bacterium]
MRSIRQKRKAVGRKSLLSRFVYRYRMILLNEDEQRAVFGMKVSHLLLTVLVLLVAGLGAWGGIALYVHSPGQVGNDQEKNMTRQTIVNDALRIDSLEHEVELQNRYITNIQDIIAGTVKIDTVWSVDSLAVSRSDQLMERSEREETFMRQYEESERYSITSQEQPVNDVSSISMFRPTAGLVTEHYNSMENHLGVDIAASPNQSVVAVMDGTVVLATYTSEMGYTICIAHPGNLISVYKHCESVLKKSGDKVRQGDVVALVGRGTDDLLQGAHLHYELWYQEQPLDPEKYILFQ